MVNKARTSAFGAGSISVSKFSTGSPVDIPKISSIIYSGDDTATPPAGGDTITVNGSFFKPGCYVYVDRTQASVVSFISSTQITFVAPAKSAGTYTLYVYNPDGGTAIYIPGMNYSGTPTWSTASGSIGTAYETVELSSNVTVLSASSDSTIKYRLYSGSLPTNAVLNTNTGAITGVTTTVAGVTTYTFVIEAYDLENQGVLRTFSITINPDVVTWSSPADGTLYNATVGSAFSQALSASSVVGQSITYTANTLPGGLSISGSNITGTLTAQANTTSLITATASTSNKTATRTLLFYVKTVPNAPTIGTATVTGSTTATVAFTAPVYDGNSPITQYIATSSPGNITATGSSSPINMTGLTTGTSYTFTVKAVNAAGQSNASSSSNSITTYSISGAPTIGSATATSSTTASISFTAPASNGGTAITSYTAVSSPGNITGTLSQAGSGTINVSGLTPGTTYSFTVYATNSVGNSSSSSSSNSVTLITVPNAPTIGSASATGQTTATVSFSAPAFNGGATITSYTAVSSPGGVTGTLTQSGSGTISISGLSASTSYTFTVYATNSVGNSSSSSSSNQITTQAAIPPSVEFMVVAGGGSGGGGFDRGGGGGGAGGMMTGTQPISQGTPYNISIGGGAGSSPNFGPSSSGSPSTFASYTGNGGGGGGTSFQNSTPAQSGGCGGGGGQNGNMGGAPGNQGYPGGNGRDGGGPGPWVGGGGGGMGSAGTSPGGSPAGPGGDGLAPGISGPGIYYSGGGGGGGQNASGGSGGNGGGGPGGSISSGNSGSSYTGGGGGGGAGDGGPGNPGGAGGSGVVVIAYPTAYPGITNISPGLAYDVPGGRSGYRVYRFYGGSGPISW